MCGLVGVVGKMGEEDRKNFVTLLKLDTIRGHHSTGVFGVSNEMDTLRKWVGTPYDCPNPRFFESLFGYMILMGHNRWATQGAINEAGAHPFDMGNIVGAHNGTLLTRHGLDDPAKFPIDSENIFYHMDKHGVEDTIKVLDGAFALTWYNKEEESFNIVRNDERPMTIAVSKSGVMYYASERWMLEVALGSSIHEINELAVGKWMRVTFNDDRTIKNVSFRKVEFYVRPKVTYTNYGYKPFTSYVSAAIDKYKGKSKLEVVKPVPSGFYNSVGEEISKEQFNHITQGGCCWCTSPVAKSSDVVWLNHDDFVCSDCAEFDEVKQYVTTN